MTTFPGAIDNDLTLPPVSNSITETGAEAIQAIREAIFAIEEVLGINPQGSASSVASRLSVMFNPDGTISYDALVSAGLLASPIRDAQVASDASISESKLNLNYSTQDLHDLYEQLQDAVDVINGFLSITGVKVEPHLSGSQFRHKLSHIDVDSGTLNRVNIDTGTVVSRNLTNAYTFTSQLSGDLLSHTRADGYNNITTPPADMAHNAAGIYINPTNFVSIPQINDDLQSFAEYVDSSSLALLGSRTQNLFSNGIPRSIRASSLVNNEAGQAVVDPVFATTYLLYNTAVNPVDDIDHGDNVILMTPGNEVLSNNKFDAQFSQVKPGDYITIKYDDDIVPVTFTIDSVKKYLDGSNNRVYTVRIHGKNLLATNTAVVRIDRPYFQETKFNALAVGAANNSFSGQPSLTIASPRGATALGIGFNPDQLDRSHYNLYLALYPTGNPVQKTLFLPAIDVTGNSGSTPGRYTLESVVSAMNDRFRSPGYNYRFVAFAYEGQVGISLADHYDDCSFSIISGQPDGYTGQYIFTSNVSFPQNIVDNFGLYDPLGLGFSGSNIASPPFSSSYVSPNGALVAPTLIIAPVRRNFFYADGVERDNFSLEILTTKDGYGDGYWLANLVSRTSLSGRVEVSYDIELDLSTSGLKVGKTIVVQPAVAVDSGSYNSVDYGRFTISNVVFTNCPGPMPLTTITVYDGIHGTGLSPFNSSSPPLPVKLYFSDDSVSFDSEQVSDAAVNTTFNRFFEVYVSPTGKSSTHERARFNLAGTDLVVDSTNGFTLFSDIELNQLNIVDISPKLRGYTFGQYKKITLFINSYDATTGIFDGFLCKFQSPSTYTNQGPTIRGKKGEVVRFYDETTVDYIDITFNINDAVSSFTLKQIDIQIYTSLELNQEKILVSKCSMLDTTKKVSKVLDARQFGNVSEKNLSTSALNYIHASPRELAENGVIRGFDLVSISDNQISIRGGSALIDGQVTNFNDEIIYVPGLYETLYPAFTTNVSDSLKWYLCVNKKGDFELVASTDYLTTLSSTYGSLNHNRIFYARNPNSPSTPPYAIRSSYLQKLMLDLHDLVPLYIINSSTTLISGIYTASSVQSSDIRRYVSKGHQGLSDPFILSNTGSYRSISAIKNTITELTNNISYSIDKTNAFGNTVKVRDTFDISGITFDFPVVVNFVGDNGRFNVVSSNAIINKNTIFKNLFMGVSSDIGFRITGDNICFEDCDIEYSYDATSDVSYNTSYLCNISKGCIYGTTAGILAAGNIGKNIKVNNCKFSSANVNRFAFINLLLSGQNHYLENITITNNKIETLTGNDTDDRKAVIVVSCSSVDTPTSLLGPRLVNCQIVNNICNKNQLIIMSGSVNGNNQIPNMISPVNVAIQKNICGAICYLTRQDRQLNVNNQLNINDKDNFFIISENVTRYIYCGVNTGFINVIGSSNRVINDIISGSDIYSSCVLIENNVCSWMHIGVKNPTNYGFESPIIEIEGNRLTAYNPTYLLPYHSVITPVNIGMLVDSIQGT